MCWQARYIPMIDGNGKAHWYKMFMQNVVKLVNTQPMRKSSSESFPAYTTTNFTRLHLYSNFFFLLQHHHNTRSADAH